MSMRGPYRVKSIECPWWPLRSGPVITSTWQRRQRFKPTRDIFRASVGNRKWFQKTTITLMGLKNYSQSTERDYELPADRVYGLCTTLKYIISRTGKSSRHTEARARREIYIYSYTRRNLYTCTSMTCLRGLSMARAHYLYTQSICTHTLRNCESESHIIYI